MKHLEPDDLILQFYGEHGDADAARAHIEACAECAASYDRLRKDLAALTLDAPTRGEDYARRVWERLEPALGRRAAALPSSEAARRRPALRRAAAFLAIAAALVIAFLFGRRMGPEPGANTAAATGERVLLVAVGDHLERSRVILLELAHADPDHPLDVSSRRVRAEQLLDASRLYRQSAERAGETGIASVLGDVERVLAEVANAPETLSAPDVRDLGERIDGDGLLFKVQVLGSQVKERQRTPRPGAAGSVS
jgi:hypothetical protein